MPALLKPDGVSLSCRPLLAARSRSDRIAAKQPPIASGRERCSKRADRTLNPFGMKRGSPARSRKLQCAGNDPGYRCYLHGMLRIMIRVLPIQFVIMPETTYLMPELLSTLRRIYTDGRDWPARLQIELTP